MSERNRDTIVLHVVGVGVRGTPEVYLVEGFPEGVKGAYGSRHCDGTDEAALGSNREFSVLLCSTVVVELCILREEGKIIALGSEL